MSFSDLASPMRVLCVVLGLAACADTRALVGPELGDSTPTASRAAQPASTPAPDKQTAKFEIDFMQGMIDHHAMAVAMAELCVQKAIHEELRQLCGDIIAAQSAEIQQMQGWLQEWYGVSYEPRMTNGAMRQMEKLASLSGAEFEIAFMEQMIRHHEAAIKEARTCLRRAYHVELRQLCENIIATQSAEIEQLQNWLCQWYGICK